jgi:NADPH-dependent curcumin reductase CurA
MAEEMNRRVVLVSRPKGEPTEANFRLESSPIPRAGPDEFLLRNHWLSVDPYMRGRMSDAPSYAKPVPIGGVMEGGTAGEVVQSNTERFSVGEFVVVRGGWQDYSVIPPGAQAGAYKVDPTELPLQTALGVAGMPGATAYFGLLELGKPAAGETLVVSAAAGAVGSAVGQIGKLNGCRVVGIAGGPEKCGVCTEEFGFDACIDYKSAADLPAALAEACPDGIDIYFENVGGAVLEAVIPLFNAGARMPICGFISQYNAAERRSPWDVIAELENPPEGRFFLVGEWADRMGEATGALRRWVREGKLRYRETITEGLENAPSAFLGMLKGANIGKQLVKIV